MSKISDKSDKFFLSYRNLFGAVVKVQN